MRKCEEGEYQNRGIVYMSAVGSVGAGVGAEKGDGGLSPSRAAPEVSFGVAVAMVAWLQLQVLAKKTKWCPFGGACARSEGGS